MERQFKQEIKSAAGKNAEKIKNYMVLDCVVTCPEAHFADCYVGITNDMDANYSRHKNDEFKGKDFDYICIYECDTAEIAAEVEKLMQKGGFDIGDTTKKGNGGVEDSKYVYMFLKPRKMAHKTFISYKYSEAQDLRDRIIESLGDDAQYYKGETSDSPDLTDTSTENIKKNLRDMMFDTSVTIVIISPHMKESKWIDWELEYCLKLETRKGRTSRRNGIVGVIQKTKDGYGWFKEEMKKPDGCTIMTYKTELVYDIITNNRANQVPKQYNCNECKCIDRLTGSYISFVEEEEFLANPYEFIDNAYDKSENDASGYKIQPTR